jgi:SAM-dependent methyltransferase
MPEVLRRAGSGIRRWLQLEHARSDCERGDLAATLLHAEVIRRKKFLRRLYRDYYRLLQSRLPGAETPARIVELGSGGGFIQAVIPGVVTSDVLALPGTDLCFSALEMPFRDASVDAFVMVNVFHHLPDVRRFLRQVDRSLRAGGKVVMIEPANTPLARWIYRRFHHEPFDPGASWGFDGDRPLWDANGAIPWIVFSRDRRQFEREFPALSIVSVDNHSPLRYLASGGVSMRQLLPTWTYGLVVGLERLLAPLHDWTGLFQTIELRKGGAS